MDGLAILGNGFERPSAASVFPKLDYSPILSFQKASLHSEVKRIHYHNVIFSSHYVR